MMSLGGCREHKALGASWWHFTYRIGMLTSGLGVGHGILILCDNLCKAIRIIDYLGSHVRIHNHNRTH